MKDNKYISLDQDLKKFQNSLSSIKSTIDFDELKKLRNKNSTYRAFPGLTNKEKYKSRLQVYKTLHNLSRLQKVIMLKFLKRNDLNLPDSLIIFEYAIFMDCMSEYVEILRLLKKV